MAIVMQQSVTTKEKNFLLLTLMGVEPHSVRLSRTKSKVSYNKEKALFSLTLMGLCPGGRCGYLRVVMKTRIETQIERLGSE